MRFADADGKKGENDVIPFGFFGGAQGEYLFHNGSPFGKTGHFGIFAALEASSLPRVLLLGCVDGSASHQSLLR
jgi:hypothetical protein